MNKLEKVLNHLIELGRLYNLNSDNIRSGTFNNAARVIKETVIEIPEDLSHLPKMKGIGPSVINEIKEVLETGSSYRLQELLKERQFIDEEVSDKLSKIKNLLKKKQNDNS